MKKIDLDRAIEAFRWACPNNSVLKRLMALKKYMSALLLIVRNGNIDAKGIYAIVSENLLIL